MRAGTANYARRRTPCPSQPARRTRPFGARPAPFGRNPWGADHPGAKPRPEIAPPPEQVHPPKRSVRPKVVASCLPITSARRVRISRVDLDRIIEHGSTRPTAAALSRPAPGSAPSIWDGEVPPGGGSRRLRASGPELLLVGPPRHARAGSAQVRATRARDGGGTSRDAPPTRARDPMRDPCCRAAGGRSGPRTPVNRGLGPFWNGRDRCARGSNPPLSALPTTRRENARRRSCAT